MIAEDYTRAADLIEGLAPDILTNENHELVIRWIERLPESIKGQIEEAKACLHETIKIAKKTGSLSLALISYTGLGEALRDEDRLV
ncbi:MAG: hypothetical protein JXJ17_01770 [Anaerolineae bacterium]|nr:hypothetical protein [Anaerolineae bacterium]